MTVMDATEYGSIVLTPGWIQRNVDYKCASVR